MIDNYNHICEIPNCYICQNIINKLCKFLYYIVLNVTITCCYAYFAYFIRLNMLRPNYPHNSVIYCNNIKSIIKTLLDYIDLLNVYVWYSTVVI